MEADEGGDRVLRVHDASGRKFRKMGRQSRVLTGPAGQAD